MVTPHGRLVDPTPPEAISPIFTIDLPDYARTAEEWWQIAERIWPAILVCAKRVGFDEVAIARMEEMRKHRDKALASRLDSLWLAAPDEYFIHTWPQWSRICDLCSERGVLEEE